MPLGSTNLLTSPFHTNKTFVQVHLLQEFDLQLSKPKSSKIEAPCKILQLKKGIS